MIYSAVLQWSAELTTVECKGTYINKRHIHTHSLLNTTLCLRDSSNVNAIHLFYS